VARLTADVDVPTRMLMLSDSVPGDSDNLLQHDDCQANTNPYTCKNQGQMSVGPKG